MNFEDRVIDKETGELLSIKLTTRRKVSADEFIQIYLEDMAGLLQITSRSEMNVLIYLWKYSLYADETQIGNMVKIDKLIKDKIMEGTGLTDGTIRNTITSLKKKGLIIADDIYSGVYYLNPTHFFKGGLDVRAKCYQRVLEYNIE